MHAGDWAVPPPEQAPRKSRRDSADTRSAILETATRRFAFQGYEQSGVREIAEDAGVTAAMVNRYFGSKEGLFTEVVKHAFPESLIEESGVDIADRLARMVVHGKSGSEDDRRIPLLLLIRSSMNPRALELLKTNLNRTRNMHRVLADFIGGPDAEVRAAMAIAQCVGFTLVYRMVQMPVLTGASQEQLVALLSESLAAITG
jgi:AcrR family transcriptional regulator